MAKNLAAAILTALKKKKKKKKNNETHDHSFDLSNYYYIPPIKLEISAVYNSRISNERYEVGGGQSVRRFPLQHEAAAFN